jgi:hypothetical protein
VKFRDVVISEETMEILDKVEERIALGYGMDLKTRNAIKKIRQGWANSEVTEFEDDPKAKHFKVSKRSVEGHSW